MTQDPQQAGGTRTGEVRRERKSRYVVAEGADDDPSRQSVRAGFNRRDELQGARFRRPECGKFTAVLRRFRRPKPLIGIDYWLLCLSWRRRTNTIFVRVEDLQAVLATFPGPDEIALVLREN
jgi:hypothetical protein